MKNKLFTFLFLVIPFCSAVAQTVIKIPFQQPEPFIVQPQAIDKSIKNASIELGLEIEIQGGSGNYLFSWIYNDEEIGTNPTISVSEEGVYILSIKDGEGCESSVTYTISNETGIKNIDMQESSSFVLYPNPTTGAFSVQSPENQEPDKVEVYNLEGKRMTQDENLPAGHYLVTLHFGNKRITKVLIVVK